MANRGHCRTSCGMTCDCWGTTPCLERWLVFVTPASDLLPPVMVPVACPTAPPSSISNTLPICTRIAHSSASFRRVPRFFAVWSDPSHSFPFSQKLLEKILQHLLRVPHGAVSLDSPQLYLSASKESRSQQKHAETIRSETHKKAPLYRTLLFVAECKV